MSQGGDTSNTELAEILGTIGLSSLEARAYLELARGGQLTAAESAKRTGIARPEVYEVLRNLENKGFVRQTLGRPAKFAPVDPLELRTRILREEKKRFDSIEAGMSKILEVWPFLRAIHDPESRIPKTMTLRSRKKIAAMVDSMVAKASESISMCTTRRGILTAMQADFSNIAKKLVDEGVETRIVIDEASISKLPPSFAPKDVEVRVSKGPKARFYIVDEREVLYHLHLQAEEDLWGSDETALWTDSQDQVSVYGWIFRNEWEKGIPLRRPQIASHKAQSRGGS